MLVFLLLYSLVVLITVVAVIGYIDCLLVGCYYQCKHHKQTAHCNPDKLLKSSKSPIVKHVCKVVQLI